MSTATEPGGVVTAVRKEIYALDPNLAPYAVTPMEQLIAERPATFLRRYPALLLAVFAALALTLAAIGIYGVISYAVSQRTHELGIRIALGAGRNDVLKLVLGQGLRLALLGIASGLAASVVLTRWLQSLLFGVSTTDPLIFGSVTVVLVLVALLACYLPARRAAKVDPLTALRYE